MKEKWYNKKWLVILLLILFFPAGIYALWKSENITQTWKTLGTSIVSVLVIINVVSDKVYFGTPPTPCDCFKNAVRKETKEFNQQTEDECAKYAATLQDSEKEDRAKEGFACLKEDNWYQAKIKKAEKEKLEKLYKSKDYLMSGTWSVVNNGMRIAIQFKTGNKYYWEDDLQGFSSGTWEGDAEYLTLYEQSFPIAKGAINSQGELKLNMQGGFYMTLKKQ